MRRFSPAPTGGKAKSGCKGTKKKGKEKEKSKKIASAAIKKKRFPCSLGKNIVILQPL